MKSLKSVLIAAFLIACQPTYAAKLDPNSMSFTARQLLQIALQDDKRISYKGLDGKIGPKTISAIKKWQRLEGKSNLDPLDSVVVCSLIRKGIRGHGSGSKLPKFCS